MNLIKTGLIKFRALLLAMVIMSVLAGCVTVGPDYALPDVSLPAAWSAEMKSGLIIENLDKQAPADWWLILDDPVLTSLIEQAVASNLDLKEARARVREARALRGISKANRFPTIDAIEAAEAELQVSEEDLRDVLVSLLAEVALNYVEVRSFQARLLVAHANLDAQKETYNIAQWRFQAGLSTRLDVEQAKYNLEQTRSRIPDLNTGLAQAGNRLSVLLGQYPGSLEMVLSEHKAIPVTPLEVAVGVPADVLRHRPDVRRAERQLAAQTAQIGVATADLYPKFSLLGSIGLEALSLDNLFLVGSRTHSIGPSITWPVFDAGTIRKNIEVQSAQQEQALIQYEAAILKALEEVENALVAYAEEHSRRQSLSEATEAAQQAVDLAQSLYLSGLIDFTDVLDAQRSLLSFQDQLSISESEVTSNLITLYKALGGGWTPISAKLLPRSD